MAAPQLTRLRLENCLLQPAADLLRALPAALALQELTIPGDVFQQVPNIAQHDMTCK